MAVNLSPVGGVAAQFFTNTGAVLTGGKIYTYAAGTTTPATTYTSSNGATAWTNPIVLDAAGRVPSGGEIWLTDGVIYKFVLKDSTDVLIATYDNITGINSNSVAYTNQQEIQTATAGQTVFNLGISYQPGTNSLSVFVDGVNQYGPGAQYAYTETDSDTITFVSGLHVGAVVKFTTTQQQGAGAVNASQVTYNPAGTGAVAESVQAKLRQTVSVMDFGAVGDGTTDDTAAIQAAVNSLGVTGGTVLFPKGIYAISSPITVTDDITLQGFGTAKGASGSSILGASVIKTIAASNFVNINSVINNFTMDRLYVVSAITSGAVLSIDSTGGVNNLLMRQVYVQGMANALYVGSTASIVHAQIEFCQFGYNSNEHVVFNDGADVGSTLFLSTRFEPAGDGRSLLKATGTTLATGSMKFINCVFESANAQYAVNCGSNVIAWSFIGCHFENNAGPVSGSPTAAGSDIYIGGGQANVNIDGCSFSNPYSTATSFYNITSVLGAKVIASNNTVNGQGHAGYLGFISGSYDCNVTLVGNKYNEVGSPAVDYTSGLINPVRFNDFQLSLKYGAVNGPIVKSVTTTNATPTKIWGDLYQLQASSALFAVADVVGTDVTGAVYCAFTTRVLVTANASDTATIRGTTTETGIASGAQAASFALTGTTGTAGLVLNVTGIAATTIKWVANVTLNKIGF